MSVARRAGMGFGIAMLVAALLWDARPAGKDPLPASPRPPAARGEPIASGATTGAVPALAAIAVPGAPPGAGIDCPHFHLDIRHDGRTERGCVATARQRVDGSRRRLLFVPEGAAAWTLEADLVAGRVAGIRLSSAPSGRAAPVTWACRGRACGGVRLEREDGRAEPLLAIPDLLLVAEDLASGREPGARGDVRLEARLALPALACPLPAASLSTGNGMPLPFCPLGGAGFEIADDGHAELLWRDLEGRVLAISLDPAGGVAAVSLDGHACRAPACGDVGVATEGAPDDPAAARRFTFSGVPLFGAGSRASARLDGGVAMPAQ